MSQPPDPNDLEARLADLAQTTLENSRRSPEEDKAALDRLFKRVEEDAPED